MMQPKCFIAFAPRGDGLLCAMTYFAYGEDVAGWFVGLKDHAYASAYFRIENFFSPADKHFYATSGSDVYGGWRLDYGAGQSEVDPPVPVDDDLCHPLEKLEDAFAAEWLVFRGDKHFVAEAAVYAAEDLPAGEVVVHHAKLAKFARAKPVWIYYSPGFNDEVLSYMAPRWPLDYGAE